jgi:hypothetical protein
MTSKFGDFTRRRFQKNNFSDRLARNEGRTDDALRKRVSIGALNDLTPAAGDMNFTSMESDTYGLIDWLKTIGLPIDEAISIYALAYNPIDECVYIGGLFTTLGGVNAPYIAKYDPATKTISALSTGLNNSVFALAVDSTGLLYIGGAFTNAGGDANADLFCKWDGAAFSACGTAFAGASGAVNALAIDASDDVYIGGNFTNIGDANGDYIVKWDGAAYSSLSTGLSAQVKALAVDSTGLLYVGGAFTNAGGDANADTFCKWNGSAFSACGSAFAGAAANYPYALLVDPATNEVYIGGTFVNIGDANGDYIVKWDGSAYTSLSTGVLYPVASLAKDQNGNICIGTANGSGFSPLYVWDGETYASLAGLDTGIGALCCDLDTLYMGGSFREEENGRIMWALASYGPATLEEVLNYLLVQSARSQVLGCSIDATLAASTARYTAPWREDMAGTAAQLGVVMPRNGTIKNLSVRITTAQPATGLLYVIVYEGTSATALQVAIPAGGAAGIYTDTTNSFYVAKNAAASRISFYVDNQATSASASIGSISVEFY